MYIRIVMLRAERRVHNDVSSAIPVNGGFRDRNKGSRR